MSSIQYEKGTVYKMIQLYCRKKHKFKNGNLCNECDAVNRYTQLRLDKCPFGDEKQACEDCKIHCYKPDMRSKIREIMRFSGPRFLLYYPGDFLRHIFFDKNKSKNIQR